MPKHLRRCTSCITNVVGDERHCVFDCPHYEDLWQQHAELSNFQDSHAAMRDIRCTRTGSLFVLLGWPLSSKPGHHERSEYLSLSLSLTYDRFVLIGLCWRYERS